MATHCRHLSGTPHAEAAPAADNQRNVYPSDTAAGETCDQRPAPLPLDLDIGEQPTVPPHPPLPLPVPYPVEQPPVEVLELNRKHVVVQQHHQRGRLMGELPVLLVGHPLASSGQHGGQLEAQALEAHVVEDAADDGVDLLLGHVLADEGDELLLFLGKVLFHQRHQLLDQIDHDVTHLDLVMVVAGFVEVLLGGEDLIQYAHHRLMVG
mmetsp:Transcript_18521/g.52887  ORF Transcript_18521/g.52887 Transcript_18521/m.52887 type:complete len:209 (-) Transcript_18521:410-1036(-)